LDEIEISVDGIDFFYNVRGFPVEQLVRNIKKFNEIKRKKKKNNPTITFTFVAMKDNLYELLGVIKLAASLGVKKVFVHPLVIYYPCLLEQNIYKDKEKSIKILNEAKKLAVSLGLELVRRRMSLVEDEGTRKSDKYICMEPFERFHINWRGDANVICCGDRNLFMEGAVFNLRDCSVEEIWNCKEYRQVRLELLNNKLENKCKECGLIFGSADNTVSIVDPEYIPYSLRRFSEKLWIENVDQRAVFQEKLLRRKYKAEENLKIQADILKSKIEEVAQVSEELYQARKNIVEKETVISKQEKVIKANEQKFIKKDAAITEQQNVIEEKEAYIQFIWQSKLWKFLKLVKKLVKFFSIKKNNNKVK
ncbi:MAG: SPASM domain-containing protein, partial [Candidatus Omnitrophica bacterium]|nr:SPASM domain-containing protein [Candidatus Omnitrophota bacterium]